MTESLTSLLKKKNDMLILLSKTVLACSYEPLVGMKERRELSALMRENEARRKSIDENREISERLSSIETAIADELEKMREDEALLEEKLVKIGRYLTASCASGTASYTAGLSDAGRRNPFKRVLEKIDPAMGQKEEMRRLRSLSESFLSSEVIDGLDDELIRLRSDAVCLRNDISMRADTLSSLEAERAKQNALLHQDVPLLEEDEAHLAYGSYLFESGEKWVNESTPEEVLDIISSILETESAIKERDEKDREKVNSLRAEEIDALIRENILHIKALEQEKRRIDAKIEALSRENSSLEEEKNALT